MYSAHNEGKSVVTERFIRTSRIKFKNTWRQFQKMFIFKLDGIVNNYNTYHSTIKMKLLHVKSSTSIDSSKETNDKNLKCKVGENLRISKYKNNFARVYTANWSEVVFVVKKVKNNVQWTSIKDLNGEEIVGIFDEN